MNEILKQCESAFYVFDLERARARIRFLREHLPEGVALCYAVKANTFIIGTWSGLRSALRGKRKFVKSWEFQAI